AFLGRARRYGGVGGTGLPGRIGLVMLARVARGGRQAGGGIHIGVVAGVLLGHRVGGLAGTFEEFLPLVPALGPRPPAALLAWLAHLRLLVFPVRKGATGRVATGAPPVSRRLRSAA